MKIGLIVDGESEYRSLPFLIDKLGNPSVTVLYPLRADIQPYATVKQMAIAVSTRLAILGGKKIDRAIVLIDRENRGDCPSKIAQELAGALQPFCAQFRIMEVEVSVKDRMYENWLIADTGCFQNMRGRFRIPDSASKAIAKDGSDRHEALNLLKRAAWKTQYSKVDDSMRIMQRATPLGIAENSRSFRRFLRLLRHPTYTGQSRNPSKSITR
jgi:hypothetical protein